jgi:hypothetical protein
MTALGDGFAFTSKIDKRESAPTARHYSAVVGSMVSRTSDALFAGKPPSFACSRTMSALGAMNATPAPDNWQGSRYVRQNFPNL